jgi:pimeloyl-ACP methyl ester carboxylesterase
MVFVHGVGLCHQVWDPQIEEFSRDHQVIAYDTLGHGASPLPAESMRLDAYIGQLAKLFDDLGLAPATLVGHSMGALIIIGFALAYPERCRHIVPMNATFDRSPEHRMRSRKTAELLAQGRAGEILEGTLSRWFTPTDSSDPKRAAKIEQIRCWLAAADPLGYARAYRVFAEEGDAFVEHLGELPMPALFLTAEGDQNSTPEMSRRMSEAAPRGEVCIIPGERHMLPAIAPEKVNPVLRGFIDAAGR